MAGGFHGVIWEVDLSNQRAVKVDIAEEDFRLYLGGSGLGARMLLQELDTQDDPLSMHSPLLFFPGMITGSPAPTACRTIVMGRSPLTEIWGEATAGGFWGAELKASGVDGILIRGRAEKPVYLWITPEGLEIKDASHIWGKDTYETDGMIRGETDDRARVSAIGPAGENLSLIASVMFEGHNARAAGRCGFGALMGSKNLKAVAVRAKGRVPVHDPDGMKTLLKEHIPQIQQFAAGLTKFGTSGGVEAVEALGDLPIKNWRLGSWAEGATAISGQTNLPKYLDKHYACFGCPIRCGKLINIPANGDGKAIRTHNPEYETLAGFGANLLNDDFSIVARAGDMCNRLGLDTMSTSSTVAFAMECYEKGLITKKDTGGLEIAWGDANAILNLIRMIAYGEGVGAVLAKGTKKAAEEIGPRSEAFAVGVKGLEVAFHDPRAFSSMAVSYATSARGACHLEGLTYFLGRGTPLEDMGYTEPPDPHIDDGKAKIAFDLQNFLSPFNALGLCKFIFIGRIGPKIISNWFEKITGFPMDQEQYLQIGERLFNLKRMFNVRLGVNRKDDVLPPRLNGTARPDGKAEGVIPNLGKMLHEYYHLRGWDEDGVPTSSRLADLGLGWTVES